MVDTACLLPKGVSCPTHARLTGDILALESPSTALLPRCVWCSCFPFCCWRSPRPERMTPIRLPSMARCTVSTESTRRSSISIALTTRGLIPAAYLQSKRFKSLSRTAPSSVATSAPIRSFLSAVSAIAPWVASTFSAGSCGKVGPLMSIPSAASQTTSAKRESAPLASGGDVSWLRTISGKVGRSARHCSGRTVPPMLALNSSPTTRSSRRAARSRASTRFARA